jgi:hypothetical protein
MNWLTDPLAAGQGASLEGPKRRKMNGDGGWWSLMVEGERHARTINPDIEIDTSFTYINALRLTEEVVAGLDGLDQLHALVTQNTGEYWQASFRWPWTASATDLSIHLLRSHYR